MTRTNRRHYYDVRQYAVLTNEKEEILVLQLPMRYKPYGGKWTLPGGKMEPHDKPESGLLREIKEETQLSAQVEKPLHISRWDTNRSRKLAIFYKCSLTGRRKQPVLSEEHYAGRWIARNEIPDVPFYSPYFMEALKKL
jgi:8-oxo-dGTP diphosphatase